MSLQSMTGFGKAAKDVENLSVYVEIKSLNSKGFDLSLRIPSAFREKEMELRNELQKILERGKVDISISIEDSRTQSGVKINTELIKHYYFQLTELKESLSEINYNPLTDILRFPDIIKTERREFDENDWSTVKNVVFEAVASLQQFRKDEGLSIASDFKKQIHSISEKLQEIASLDKTRIGNIKSRIRNNIYDAVAKDTIDENRFEQELIYYVEKMDINEEKVRLATHCAYFLTTMTEPACGRKLNFIAQEIGREINTIGSKANDAGIQRLVVEMKDELEKIKEQTNNVL